MLGWTGIPNNYATLCLTRSLHCFVFFSERSRMRKQLPLFIVQFICIESNHIFSQLNLSITIMNGKKRLFYFFLDFGFDWSMLCEYGPFWTRDGNNLWLNCYWMCSYLSANYSSFVYAIDRRGDSFTRDSKCGGCACWTVTIVKSIPVSQGRSLVLPGVR